MTRSTFSTSASRAAVSLTSREMGRVLEMPSTSFLADSRVLQAGGILVWHQRVLQLRHSPTVTSTPFLARTSTVGLVTKPAPRSKAFLPEPVSFCCKVVMKEAMFAVKSRDVNMKRSQQDLSLRYCWFLYLKKKLSAVAITAHRIGMLPH